MPDTEHRESEHPPDDKYVELLVADLVRKKVRETIREYGWIAALLAVAIALAAGFTINEITSDLASLRKQEEELRTQLDQTRLEAERKADDLGRELAAEFEDQRRRFEGSWKAELEAIGTQRAALERYMQVVERSNDRALDRIDRQTVSLSEAGTEAIRTTTQADLLRRDLEAAMRSAQDVQSALTEELDRLRPLRAGMEAQLAARLLFVERGKKGYSGSDDPLDTDAFRPGWVRLDDGRTLVVVFHQYREEPQRLQLASEPPLSSVRAKSKVAVVDMHLDGALVAENVRLREGESVSVGDSGYRLETLFIYLPNPQGGGYIPDFAWLRLTRDGA